MGKGQIDMIGITVVLLLIIISGDKVLSRKVFPFKGGRHDLERLTKVSSPNATVGDLLDSRLKIAGMTCSYEGKRSIL